jgi:hypothetical protein
VGVWHDHLGQSEGLSSVICGLSADEIASYLGMTKYTVYAWITSKVMRWDKVSHF